MLSKCLKRIERHAQSILESVLRLFILRPIPSKNSGFNLFCRDWICDRSDYKIITWFQSGQGKNPVLADSLNEALTDVNEQSLLAA